jgi:tetratricopeptide (TPR) repeat protein
MLFHELKTFLMHRSLLRLGLLLFLAATPSARALPPVESAWVEVRSEHFHWFSSASEDRTRDVVVALEQFRTVLDQLIPGPSIEGATETTVFVFGSTDSYGPYNLRTPSGEPTAASGFCANTPYGLTIAIDATPGRSYRQMIYHEYVHQLLFQRFPGLPIWVHEGLAEYFSTLTIQDGSARVGFAPQSHADWLLTNEVPTAYVLLSATSESVKFSEIERAGPFYAGSWLLAHYLLHDAGAGPLSVRSLLELRSTDAPYDRSLLEALGVSKRELTDRLTVYGTKKSFAFNTVPIAQTATTTGGQGKPADRADLLTRLGELQSFVHDNQAAASEHFRAALALDPGRVGAMIGLSFAAELSGEQSQAAEWFAKAAALSPKDATIYLKRADALIIAYQRSHPGKTPLGSELDPQLARAREAAQRAIELDPKLAQAYLAVGTTYVYDAGDIVPGMVALEQARRLDPTDPEITAHLAVLGARNGDFDGADALLAELRNTALDTELVRRARTAVSLAKHSYIGKLGNEGRFREAIMLLDDMIEETTDAAHKEVLQGEVRRLSHYDSYRNAVALANGGQLDNARKILTELQSQKLDAQLSKLVTDALGKLGGPREP